MSTFMVIGSFSPETDLPQMNAVVAQEVAQVHALTQQGRLGSVHVSPARGKVFLEIHAEDEDAARATIATLPMAPWWEIEIYPTVGPPPAG